MTTPTTPMIPTGRPFVGFRVHTDPVPDSHDVRLLVHDGIAILDRTLRLTLAAALLDEGDVLWPEPEGGWPEVVRHCGHTSCVRNGRWEAHAPDSFEADYLAEELVARLAIYRHRLASEDR